MLVVFILTLFPSSVTQARNRVYPPGKHSNSNDFSCQTLPTGRIPLHKALLLGACLN